MKKLLIIVAIVTMGSFLFAQDVLDDFYYTDGNTLVTPLYLSDGVTPIPDGYLIDIYLVLCHKSVI